jgi:protein O-GlcNAc transferase
MSAAADIADRLLESGRPEAALAHLRQAVARDRHDADAVAALAQLLSRMHQHEQAEHHHRRTADLLAGNPFAKANLANCLCELDKFQEAAEVAGAALSQRPEVPALRVILARALGGLNLHGQAAAVLSQGLQASPGEGSLLAPLGSAVLACGRPDQAVAMLQRASELQPNDARIAEALLCAATYDPASTPELLHLLAGRWGACVERVLGLAPARPVATHEPSRPLRVALVSPDFRRHAVAEFLEPILRAAAGAGLTVRGFAVSRQQDEVSARLRGLCDGGYVHFATPDVRLLAPKVAAWKPDVVLEAGGHAAGNRLALLHLRPAALNVSGIGFPAPVGLPACDGRIGDEMTDPPGEEPGEAMLRIPGGMVCWQPPTADLSRDQSEPGAPPCVGGSAVPGVPPSAPGTITFGSFAATAKLCEPTLALFARVLLGTPGSRLLLRHTHLRDQVVRERIVQAIAAHGVDPSRVVVLEPVPTRAMAMAQYRAVDVALDTWPYNGTTTTVEALWMGVPVVSLVGERTAARMGLSILSAAGRSEWAAPTPEAYVQTAHRLAGDPPGLTAQRATLRSVVEASRLCDAAAFAAVLHAQLSERLSTLGGKP